jgi:ATP-dependent Lon protease
MSDDILDETELDEKDDGIAFVKGDLIHHKIIPILLRTDVVFPCQHFHLETRDENWKKILEQAHEENSVIGVMYRNEETEDLPPLGRVATSATIDELHKIPDGSNIAKIIPVNRFFTKEYVETEPVLRAEVSYYGDKPEDDEIILPLLEEFLPLLHRMGKMGRSKYLGEMTLETLRDDIQLLSFLYFKNNPKLTKDEELYALWMYHLSERLVWIIEIMESMINERVERLADVYFQAKNN